MPKLTEFEKRNRAFKKASAAQKRVLIAKDVLKQLKLGKIKAKQGVYVTAQKYDWTNNINPDKEFCELNIKCSVCALGAAMLSEIRMNNNLKVREMHGYNYSVKFGDNYITSRKESGDRLDKYFTESQLVLIERAFEGWGDGKVKDFYCKYRNDNKRIAAIFRNIIQNKGTFKL